MVPVFSIEINSTTQLPVMHCLRETNTFRALTKRAGFDPTVRARAQLHAAVHGYVLLLPPCVLGRFR